MPTFKQMELVDLAHSVSKFCIGMEGNVSSRYYDTDRLLIKASGKKLSTLDTCGLSEYSISDGKLINGIKGSIETDFHRVIYKYYPEVNFIAHTHPINTLKILCGDANILFHFERKRLYPEQVIFNGPYSMAVGYHNPGKDLAKGIENEILHYELNSKPQPKLILLDNHGIIALGKTAQECVAITETCEKAAEVFLGALSTGKIRYLSDSSVQELLDDENEKYRMALV